jgi:hypothetical protein
MHFRKCEGFSDAGVMKVAPRARGRRPKASNEGNRGTCGEMACQTLWGFRGREREYKFYDMARTFEWVKKPPFAAPVI